MDQLNRFSSRVPAIGDRADFLELLRLAATCPAWNGGRIQLTGADTASGGKVMSFTVNPNPARLTWSNFTVVGATTDNHDAYTRPQYNIPQAPIRRVNNRFMLAANTRINITPLAQVRQGVTQTDALLSHEQIHFDLGILAERAMAREMETLDAATPADLSVAFNNSFTLHKDTRLGPLQLRYDNQTNHGTVPQQQQRWQSLITQCLADPNCSQVDGLPL